VCRRLFRHPARLPAALLARYAIPNFNVAGWLLNGLSQVRDYVDPQWQAATNAGWTKGPHNVKFGFEYTNLHQNHYEYETQVQDFTFNGGLTSLNGGPAPNNFSW
jgi:hypothetical protein